MTAEQDRFAAALLDPGAARPEGLEDGGHRAAGRRFDVYRNNVTVSLIEALQSGFPVLTRLLGEANMAELARQFLRAHPPSSPLLMLYGEGLPEFIARQEALAHLPYLPDVARLELAIRQSYHAADAAPIDPGLLATIPPEELLAARLRLAPALRLLRSAHPVCAIWRYNMEDGAPRPEAGAQDVLITRPEFDPVPLPLPPGGGDWIAALAEGMTIGEALDAVADQPFDPGPSLTQLIQGNAITAIEREP